MGGVFLVKKSLGRGGDVVGILKDPYIPRLPNTLGLEVIGPQKTTQKTFSAGIWKTRISLNHTTLFNTFILP